MFSLPSGSLAIIGDTHQNTEWLLLVLRSLKTNHPEIDYYIQVGDFGLGVGIDGASFLRKVNKALKNNNKHMFVLLGNHDNYDKYGKASPSQVFPGTRTFQEASNIHFFERQAWFTMNNMRFLAVCGANSINRNSLSHKDEKINGIKYLKSWWPEEQITDTDVANAVSGGEADILLCHDAPTQGFPLTEEEANVGREMWSGAGVAYAEISGEQLQKVLEAVKPSKVFHGHYHKRATRAVKILNTNAGTTFESLGMNGDSKGNVVLLNQVGDVLNYDVKRFRR